MKATPRDTNRHSTALGKLSVYTNLIAGLIPVQNRLPFACPTALNADANNATTFVGLDVHVHSIKDCAFAPATGETERKSLGYAPSEVASWMKSLSQPAKHVYESGVTGFHLCRKLRAMGVDCAIGAVSKIHRPAADRGRRTERRDAHFLAVQLALGVVTGA